MNLLLEVVGPFEDLGLRLEGLVLAEPDDVLLHLLELEISAAALVGADETDGLSKFGGLALQKIWLAEQAL